MGESIKITLKINNVGVAPIYNKLPLKIRIKGISMQEFVTDIDITKWLPGEYTEHIEFTIPTNIVKGEYGLQVGIGGGNSPSVTFAIDSVFDGDYVELVKIKIL